MKEIPTSTMSSSRPYLVRAVRQWIVDNDLTPLIVVDANKKGVVAAGVAGHEGKIVFNISDSAVRRLVIDNKRVEFSARFGSRSSDISIPHHALLAIVARENGVGMSFSPADEAIVIDSEVEKTRLEKNRVESPRDLVLVDNEGLRDGGESGIPRDSNRSHFEGKEASDDSPSRSEELPRSPARDRRPVPDLKIIK